MRSTMKRLILLFTASVALLGFGATLAWADQVSPAQTAQAGSQAVYTLAIHNETGVDHSYQLAVTGLQDTLTATFVQDGPLLESITVPANGYGQISLRLDVPVDTPVGHLAGQFVATRDDGVTLANPLALTVENTYALKITGQTSNVNAFSGQEFTFETTAANSGAAVVTNLALKVDAPAKWLVQLNPPLLDSLAPGQSVTIAARVLVPASQVSIDQPLQLSLVSDQATSPASKLAVRVQKSPNYLVASAAVIALAVAGAFIYFRRKGRR